MSENSQDPVGERGRTSIFAVVVIYKLLPSESPSLKTLLDAADEVGASRIRLSILVVDNTPGGQDPGPLPAGVRYRSEPDNPGLARPYNDALLEAEENGFPWLLTLDQDTHLPVSFLSSLGWYAERYAGDPRVAAIVPRIYDNRRPISPLRFAGGFFPGVLPERVEGVSKRFTSALNSASLLRVSALRQTGGYDLRFPLHHSDTRLYQRLDHAGKRVVVASTIAVQHELAIMDLQKRMSPERYRQALVDERAFWDLHMGFLGRVERTLRLVGRVCKQVMRGEDRGLRAISVAEIRHRLLTSRRRRLEQAEVMYLD